MKKILSSFQVVLMRTGYRHYVPVTPLWAIAATPDAGLKRGPEFPEERTSWIERPSGT